MNTAAVRFPGSARYYILMDFLVLFLLNWNSIAPPRKDGEPVIAEDISIQIYHSLM